MKKLTKEYLEEEVLNKNKKQREIANELNCSEAYISKKMKEFGIRRTRDKRYKNKTYGTLYVISTYRDNETGFTFCRCECECGNIIKIRSCSLITGNTESCGCTSRKRGQFHPLYTGYKDIHGRVWTSLKRGAKNRKMEFSITIEYAWELLQKQEWKCALSGQPIRFSPRTNKQRLTTASLDRIDSKKGYIVGNVQWVHKIINRMKWDIPDGEFTFWCRCVAEKASMIDKFTKG